jgi:hypothetical protein
MAETYSRVGSMSLIKEATANTALTPTTFIPINDESISEDYSPTPSKPISGNRAENQRAIKKAIAAPNGTINVNVEPNTIGHLLNGIYGGLTSGNYVTVSAVTGTFDLVNTVTFVGSSATATPLFIGDGYIIFGTITGSPLASDTLSQAVSGATANVDVVDTAVYGHVAQLPGNNSATYSLQKNFSDRAFRYMGVRFTGLDALAQSDNIITAGIGMIAQSAFRSARVNAVTAAAGGSQVITIDQTQGLVAADSIKLYRPSTGAFIDFSAASVSTHTIDSIVADTSITVTNLETSTAVGDLIVLAPQTASYTIDTEFAWIGCSQVQLGDDEDNLVDVDVQDYSMVISNAYEEKHSASGTNIADRFPSDILQMGFTATGSITTFSENENYYRLLVQNANQAIQMETTGGTIGTFSFTNLLQSRFSKVQFDAYDTNLSADDLVGEEVPFTSYYDDSTAYSAQILLVNVISSY